MSGRSKFTADRRKAILELLSVGASRRTAAAVAGVDHATLSRWLSRGQDAPEGSRWREFYVAVVQAEAHPRIRALETVHRELLDNASLAWRYLERREEGYAPQPFVPPVPQGPVVIQLTLPEGHRPALPDVVEGEVEDE